MKDLSSAFAFVVRLSMCRLGRGLMVLAISCCYPCARFIVRILPARLQWFVIWLNTDVIVNGRPLRLVSSIG